jgi:iron complex outermembrane receptor protein
MAKFAFLFLSLGLSFLVNAQEPIISLKVISPQQEELYNVTVEVLNKDSSLLKIGMTDSLGTVHFTGMDAPAFIRASRTGYATIVVPVVFSSGQPSSIVLKPLAGNLSNVTVTARRPFIEMQAGKTIVNVESSLTSVGATAMEALEKMPGITVDKDGVISLKGKTGVTVMLDGKPTYLDPAQLATLLNGMSASQISQVEIMDNPTARYDAAGNAGIINIRMKQNRQKGFNGNASTSYAQGRYPKNNNTLQLNYRNGKWNFFTSQSVNLSRNFTRLYALRTYYKPDGVTVASFLEQPGLINGKGYTYNMRTGLDYSISNKTNIGLTLSGLSLERKSNSDNPAMWKAPNGVIDSLIETSSNSTATWKNAGANLNFKHAFTTAKELTVDVDLIGYRIRGNQFFENNLVLPSSYSEASRAETPSNINITSAKADYTEQRKAWKLEAGAKTSHITTDNTAAYEYRDALLWKPDYGRSNHFIYAENIHALYSDAETMLKKWTFQGGLRYEMTRYDAHQLGNAIVKDSSFSRSYNSLFPSFSASVAVDSLHTFSFSAGRRIDRPAFQKLNPFLFIINKYTYQRGNPFYRPQYTWNLELSHVYKNQLITSVSYSLTTDYFSQVFPIDSNGIVIYTEGNLKRLQNFGASVSWQSSPVSWWSFSVQGIVNHKKMEGFIEREYRSSVTQYQFNLNNQFRFKKGWAGEVSGFYVSKSQNDIQEFVDPAGQLSAGVSKLLLQNKATVKLAVRDIFYTQWMKGLTHFQNATEYFKLTRDTRVVSLSFSYRFGKAFKTMKRSEGASGDEIQRVGNG